MTDLLPTPIAPAAPAHSEIDRTLTPEAAEAIAAAMPASTRRAYMADWRRYVDWCAETGRVALPATPETVTGYITHLTLTPSSKTGRPLAPSSVERALAAIRTVHRIAGAAAPETKSARAVLSGYRERLALAKDPAARTRKATPAVPDALRAMLGTLDRSTLAGMRDAALLLLGYACAARISELSALDIADVQETPDGLLVTVYRRKIKTFTEVAIPYGKVPATCPVRAVRDYLAALAEVGRTSGPLFIRIDRHGRVAPPMNRGGKTIGDPSGRMTPEAIADVIARAADSAGLTGQWSGHSLRRGFATAARRAGASLERIGRHGGWADGSRALLGYLEEGDRWIHNPVTGL